MSKIVIENTEIITTEKKQLIDEEHIIKKNNYVYTSVTKTEFKSSIFLYGEYEKILISKILRFDKEYYKIVLFNEKIEKAWNLIELSAELEIKIRRLSAEQFIIIGNSKHNGNVTPQVTFCKLKPSTRTEKITINFTKLNDIHFLKNGKIAICYDDADEGKIDHLLALYSIEGALQKTLFEYPENNEYYCDYKVVGNEIIVSKIKKT